MKIHSRIHLPPGLAFVLCFCAVATAAVSASGDELKPIFNGTNLAGWRAPDSNPFWRVENGVLIGENNEKLAGHVLHTEKAYTNFIIELEARWSGEIDSGIMLRKPEAQLQIGISRSLKRDMTCSFYDAETKKYPDHMQAKGVDKLLKPGDWNKIRLQARDDEFTVWLNGEKVSQFKEAKYPKAAPIGLQIHPGLKMKVEFRNVQLKELE